MKTIACRIELFALTLWIFSACSPAPNPPPAPPTYANVKSAHAVTATPTAAPTQYISAPTRATNSTQTPPAPNMTSPAFETATRIAIAPTQTTTTNSGPALFPDQMQLQGKPFQAAMQNFENGFMLWRSDLNCVYAIRDWGDGDLRAINFVERVPNHPSTPKISGYCFRVEPLANAREDISTTPPAGKFLPVGALGKVWNTYQGIRQTLGYATAPELGYTANNPLTLPNGKILACELDYGALTTYCTQQ